MNTSFEAARVPLRLWVSAITAGVLFLGVVSASRSQEPVADSAPSAETIAKIEAYAVSIANKIQQNWIRPRGAREGFECVIRLTQESDGTVTSYELERCNGNKNAQRSVEEAILAASPLPLPSDPAIFDPVVRVTFRPTMD